MLLKPGASFDLAVRVQGEGAPIGEVFAFLSGLYFRGKLAYAMRFAKPHQEVPGVIVITSNRGLMDARLRITSHDLDTFGEVDIDAGDPRYLAPLQKSASELDGRLPPGSDVILLGSIGTQKYVQPLLEVFQTRLKFPADFVGRGDMSRGGLMLRSVEEARELDYISLDGAIRHGKRPPKLDPKTRPRRPLSYQIPVKPLP